MTTIKASILLAVTLLASGHVIALTSDITKPAIISANNQTIDLAKNFATFTGNVTIKQGSILISADRLQIFNHGNSGKEVMVLTGKPALFSQLLDQGGKMTAQAKTIRFERAKNIVSLTTDAQLKQQDSLVKSQFISYDMAKKVLLASGKGAGSSGSSKRVTTILQPTNNEKK